MSPSFEQTIWHIRLDEFATIDDRVNDMLMFGKSGISIAMGKAPNRIKTAATAVTTSYSNECFADAMERFVLGEDQ